MISSRQNVTGFIARVASWFITPLVLIAALALVGYSYDVHWWKIRNPNSQWFNAAKFDFNDYKNHEELAEVLKVLLPIGTPEADVDRLLATYGDARVVDITDEPLALADFEPARNYRLHAELRELTRTSARIKEYIKPGKSPIFVGWRVYAFFNSDGKLTQLISFNKLVF
ncbi:hypothetical protein RHECNPAF_258002 [Rhizobium etli CNPAF512]|nr:hypothetical protein RHECNPAF_258002 [Rhizobium etli CNPAF512]